VLEALEAAPLTGVLILSLVLVRGRARGRPTPDSDRRVADTTDTADDSTDTAEDTDAGRTATATLDPDVVVPPAVPDTPADLVEAPPAPVEEEPLALGERFRRRLTLTRNVLGASVADLFGRGIDGSSWEGLEEALITADVGVTATMEIVEELRRRSREEGASTAEDVLELLKQELRAVLGTGDRSLVRATDDDPTVWLITGVNGTGKTTSIGKLAAIEQREGRRWWSPPPTRSVPLLPSSSGSGRSARAPTSCARTRARTRFGGVRGLRRGDEPRSRPADRRHRRPAPEQA
jgi:fused signal recognition particle receptor